jgi:hypothetical protein
VGRPGGPKTRFLFTKFAGMSTTKNFYKHNRVKWKEKKNGMGEEREERRGDELIERKQRERGKVS